MKPGPEPSVLLVSEPGVDGVFQYVRTLAPQLIERGWRVHLAYSSRRDCPALYPLVDEVRAAGGRTLDLRVGNGPQPGDGTALIQLWRLARAVRPEVIHAHSSKAGALARSLPLLGIRARYFYTPHAYFQMPNRMNPRKRFFTVIERVFGRVGTTINVSAGEAEYARRVIGLPGARQRVVLTGADSTVFRPAADAAEKAEARRRFGLPAQSLLLGTVARYSDQKDPRTLYRALLQSLERHPALHFAHLGKGDLSGEVDALVARAAPEVRARIHRIGASDDAPAFYRALDAFTLPSQFEGFSLSALEALATGLPLIISSCLGNEDLKAYPLNGIRWVPVGDAVSLAEAIDAWADNPPAGTNHRQVVSEKIDAAEAFEKILSCYSGK